MTPSDPPESARTEPWLRLRSAPLALPTGMRDVLPPRSFHRRALAGRALAHFEQYGYQLVVPPAFEREDVLGRCLEPEARRTLLRFVEPADGEVVVLRPDLTPQIARIAATRYSDVQGPLRLMYEGSIVRGSKGRTRAQRQLSQTGIECIGWASPRADLEVLQVALEALAAVGLRNVRVEIGHAALLQEALREVPTELQPALLEALAAKDQAYAERLLSGPLPPLLQRLSTARGTLEVLAGLQSPAASPTWDRSLAELLRLCGALEHRGFGPQLLLDLAEARGIGYYTGLTWVFLVDGVGEALGAGGRYDGLLARFGCPKPATGAALNLEVIEQALAVQDTGGHRLRTRCVLAGPWDLRLELASQLRSQGLCVAEADPMTPAELLAFVRATGYSHGLLVTTEGRKVLRAEDGAELSIEALRTQASHGADEP